MISLRDREWKEFNLTDMFDISQGRKWITKTEIENNPGNIPLVSCAGTNNGIMGFINPDGISKCTVIENKLTIAVSGSAGATFYQGIKTAVNSGVLILSGKGFTQKRIYLFLCVIVGEACSKFSYNIKASQDRVSGLTLSIPVTSDGQPDYDFMEQYIREREPDYSWATGCVKPDASISLQDRQWKEFNLTDIFDTVNRGNRLTKAKRKPGKTPLITAGFLNYGVGDYIQNPDQARFKDAVTIDMFGNAFYRGTEFCCDDNIIVLQNDSISSWAKLFITPIVNMRKSQYSYVNQYRLGDLATHTVKLPVDDQGNPDYGFMERYMKSLPFSAAVA